MQVFTYDVFLMRWGWYPFNILYVCVKGNNVHQLCFDRSVPDVLIVLLISFKY